MFQATRSALKPTAAAVLFGCLGAVTASAQTTEPAAAASIVPAQAAGETNIANLIGTKVVNDASELLGDVNYLLVNSAGQITTIVVGVGGFLGVGEKNVGFPYAALSVTPSGKQDRVLKVSATKEQLAAAPPFEWRDKPIGVSVGDGVWVCDGVVVELRLCVCV